MTEMTPEQQDMLVAEVLAAKTEIARLHNEDLHRQGVYRQILSEIQAGLNKALTPGATLEDIKAVNTDLLQRTTALLSIGFEDAAEGMKPPVLNTRSPALTPAPVVVTPNRVQITDSGVNISAGEDNS